MNKHNYKHVAGGEWWDDYMCTNCEKIITTSPEDLLSPNELNKQDITPCIEKGKEDGKV